MEQTNAQWLTAFDQLMLRLDGIYHGYGRALGISDSALWLLYALYQQESPRTQKELSREWDHPAQTLNSTLKKLERQGLLECRPVPGNRKNKLVVLTDRGRDLAEQVVPPLIGAEGRALTRMGPEDTARLLALAERYVRLLQQEVEALDPLRTIEKGEHP